MSLTRGEVLFTLAFCGLLLVLAKWANGRRTSWGAAALWLCGAIVPIRISRWLLGADGSELGWERRIAVYLLALPMMFGLFWAGMRLSSRWSQADSSDVEDGAAPDLSSGADSAK